MAQRIPRTAEERFRSKFVEVPSGCWEWTDRRSKYDYGCFWNGERYPRRTDGRRGSPVTVLAHRWAYQHFRGPIPDGLYVLHRCDNPPCVNPDHLVVGTQADNVHDCQAKGRRGRPVTYHKLSPAIHAEIRRRYTGALGEQAALAREYGVEQATISVIVGTRSRSRCPGGEPADTTGRNGAAVLDQERVVEIRRRRAAGERTAALAAEFGVGVGAICDVVNRRTWKNVP